MQSRRHLAWDGDAVAEVLDRHAGVVRAYVCGHFHPVRWVGGVGGGVSTAPAGDMVCQPRMHVPVVALACMMLFLRRALASLPARCFCPPGCVNYLSKPLTRPGADPASAPAPFPLVRPRGLSQPSPVVSLSLPPSQGGYTVRVSGVHHLTFTAILDALSPDGAPSNAWAVVTLGDDAVVVEGGGEEPSRRLCWATATSSVPAADGESAP